MNKIEAKELIAKELEKYRPKSYDALVEIIDDPINYEIDVPSGVKYHIEIQVFWDDKKGGDVRVFGSIDDGGFRAFSFPLSDCFIKSSTGEFVDE